MNLFSVEPLGSHLRYVAKDLFHEMAHTASLNASLRALLHTLRFVQDYLFTIGFDVTCFAASEWIRRRLTVWWISHSNSGIAIVDEGGATPEPNKDSSTSPVVMASNVPWHRSPVLHRFVGTLAAVASAFAVCGHARTQFVASHSGSAAAMGSGTMTLSWLGLPGSMFAVLQGVLFVRDTLNMSLRA
jgi:hypothetical protein